MDKFLLSLYCCTQVHQERNSQDLNLRIIESTLHGSTQQRLKAIAKNGSNNKSAASVHNLLTSLIYSIDFLYFLSLLLAVE